MFKQYARLKAQGFQVESRLFSTKDGSEVSRSPIQISSDLEAALRQTVKMTWSFPETTNLFVVLQDGKEIAYNLDTAISLIDFGIKKFYRVNELDAVCTIGHNGAGIWAGWSHRAIAQFAIGHVVKEGDVIIGEGVKVGATASTEATARLFAVKFAEAVS
jgi:hypothetical protein